MIFRSKSIKAGKQKDKWSWTHVDVVGGGLRESSSRSAEKAELDHQSLNAPKSLIGGCYTIGLNEQALLEDTP